MPGVGRLNIDNLADMSLRTGVLAHHPAGKSLRYKENRAEDFDIPGVVPGSGISLRELLHHCLIKISQCQKLLKTSFLLLQLVQQLGFFRLRCSVLLVPQR